MTYCLGNNDKKGKSVHIQYGCSFPQEFATWLNLGIWRTGGNKKRDVFAFLQVTYITFFHLLWYVVLIEIYEENSLLIVTFLEKGGLFSNIL